MSRCMNDEEISAIQNSIIKCDQYIAAARISGNKREFDKWTNVKADYQHELNKRLKLTKGLGE